MDEGKGHLLRYQPCNTVIYLTNTSYILSHCESIWKWIMSVKSIYQSKTCLYISMYKLYPVITSYKYIIEVSSV